MSIVIPSRPRRLPSSSYGVLWPSPGAARFGSHAGFLAVRVICDVMEKAAASHPRRCGRIMHHVK